MTILDLFDGLARCAPGDSATIARITAGLAPDARVLDAGAGRGADLAALRAAVPQGQITALEQAAPFVAHMRAAFPDVRVLQGDMASPPPGPYDLIWSGGAIYNIGVTQALTAWRGSLAPGGRVAFSDLTLRDVPPSDETRDFFRDEGLALRRADDVAAEVSAAGYRLLDTFWLPDTAWEAYYTPLEQRLEALWPTAGPQVRWHIDTFRFEIALWRRCGGEYGYLVSHAVPQ